MAIYGGIRINSRNYQFDTAKQLLTECQSIVNDAIAMVGYEVPKIPVYLGIVEDTKGYHQVAAAFYSQGSPRIVVNVYTKHEHTLESMRNDLWHEVGHLAVFARDPEKYRQISQQKIPGYLHDTAINVFELLPRVFAEAKRMPIPLLALVLGGTFSKSVQEIVQVPAISASVLSHHPKLLLRTSLREITAQTKWDGIPIQAPSTEKLAILLEETLEKLQELPAFSVALQSLSY